MGRYQCWAWIQAKSGTGTVYVNTPARANAAVDINTDISPVYLGVVELPGVKAFPLRGTETATTITLNYTLSSASVWFYGMWLVPMDGQVMRVQSTAGLTGTDALMMNGPYNTVFTQSGTSYKVDYETPLSPTGEYLRLEPLRYTRVYFWTGRASLGDDAYHYYHNDEMTVYSLQVDRYSSLRGST